MNDNIQMQPLAYITSDGFKFDVLPEADCHEECLAAMKEYEKAKLRLYTAVAEKHYLTADGKPFSLRGEKWVIVERIYEPPYIAQVNLGYYSSRAAFFFNSKQELCVAWAEGDRNHEKPVDKFYSSEKAALEALIDLREKHLTWFQEDLEETRQRLKRLCPLAEK